MILFFFVLRLTLLYIFKCTKYNIISRSKFTALQFSNGVKSVQKCRNTIRAPKALQKAFSDRHFHYTSKRDIIFEWIVILTKFSTTVFTTTHKTNQYQPLIHKTTCVLYCFLIIFTVKHATKPLLTTSIQRNQSFYHLKHALLWNEFYFSSCWFHYLQHVTTTIPTIRWISL